MALSGSITTQESDGRSVTLSWSASQSVANDQSTVSWSLTGSGSRVGWVKVSELNVVMNGTQIYYRASSVHTECYNGTVLATGSFAFNHNSDGSSPQMSITIQAGIYQWAVNTSASGSWYLDTIPRASSISSVSGNTLGSSMTVNISRKSSSFTHNLWYAIGTSGWISIGSGVATSKSFTPDVGKSSYFPNATSGNMRILLRTYSGGTQIGGDVYKDVTVNVPSSVVPSISSITLSDPTGYASTFGGYVRNRSKLKVQTNASGVYGSSISKVTTSVFGGSSTSNPYTSGVISDTAGTKTVKVTATDSRGRSVSKTATFTLLEYASPTVTKLTASRCNQDGSASDEGEYILITYGGSITPLNNKNAKNIRVRIRPQGTSDWVELVSVNEYSKNASMVVQADIDKSFFVDITVSDSFTYASKTCQVSTAFTLMDFHESGKGIGFGKVAERENIIESKMDLIIPSDRDDENPVNVCMSESFIIPDDSNAKDFVSGKKSFIGSVITNNVWYDMISIRHRNGSMDGKNYGMRLYTKMTSNDSIYYTKQAGGTWSGETYLWDSYNVNYYGTWSNGCVQFPNGIQIAWIFGEVKDLSFVAWGTGYITSATVPPNYAKPFVNKPSVTVSGWSTRFNYAIIPVGNGDFGGLTKAGPIAFFRASSCSIALGISMCIIAIGRWK